MKKVLLFSLLIANFAYAAEDCPPAVEAAESQNPEAYKDCDYSDKGLNGVLHRAFKKKTDGVEVVDHPEKAEFVKEEKIRGESNLVKGTFSSAQQLQALRFSLIQKASTECSKGFLLESEKYLPQVDNTLKLELFYHCL